MRTICGRGVYLTLTLALLMLALSAESCQPTTSASTSSGAKITITSRSTIVTVGIGRFQSATASCQQGEWMLSGGYSITSPAYANTLAQSMPPDRYFVYQDAPNSPTSWTVSVLNRAVGAEAGSILLNAQVECASGLSSAPSIVTWVGGIGSLVTAPCPGAGLTGGGYQITGLSRQNDVIAIEASSGAIGNGGAGSWSVRTVFVQGSTANPQAQVRASAVCSALSTTNGAIVHVAVPSGPRDQATMNVASAPCEEGQLLTGGGFSISHTYGNLPVTDLAATYMNTPPDWAMTLYSLPVSDIEGEFQNIGGSAELIPICASIQ